jgi:Fuc2NAc and GlcNAc transferase
LPGKFYSVSFNVLVIVVAAFLLSALLTGVARRLALSRGVLDVPNARSSHETPTPRGGGAAIVLSAVAAWIALGLMGVIKPNIVIALSGGGIAIAAVGLLDDRFRLSARVRLSVHFAAAVWALFWLGGLPPVQLGNHVIVLGWGGYLLGMLGIVWTLNLFNFMDGIDGIAASEAIFVVCGGILLALLNEGGHPHPAIYLVFIAASCGFLLWNWPPARIFMGDVGSGFLGYVIAVLAVIDTRESALSLLVWLILGGVFFVDATVTLTRRLLRGEPLHEAHRTHVYQYLARRWSSHRSVTLAVLAVNVFWLLPMAMFAAESPALAPLFLATALAPLIILAFVVGAGVPES